MASSWWSADSTLPFHPRRERVAEFFIIIALTRITIFKHISKNDSTQSWSETPIGEVSQKSEIIYIMEDKYVHLPTPVHNASPDN